MSLTTFYFDAVVPCLKDAESEHMVQNAIDQMIALERSEHGHDGKYSFIHADLLAPSLIDLTASCFFIWSLFRIQGMTVMIVVSLI